MTPFTMLIWGDGFPGRIMEDLSIDRFEDDWVYFNERRENGEQYKTTVAAFATMIKPYIII